MMPQGLLGDVIRYPTFVEVVAASSALTRRGLKGLATPAMHPCRGYRDPLAVGCGLVWEMKWRVRCFGDDCLLDSMATAT